MKKSIQKSLLYQIVLKHHQSLPYWDRDKRSTKPHSPLLWLTIFYFAPIFIGAGTIYAKNASVSMLILGLSIAAIILSVGAIILLGQILGWYNDMNTEIESRHPIQKEVNRLDQLKILANNAAYCSAFSLILGVVGFTIGVTQPSRLVAGFLLFGIVHVMSNMGMVLNRYYKLSFHAHTDVLVSKVRGQHKQAEIHRTR